MTKKLKLKDLVPDDQNFNTGTEFGNGLINKSLSKFGAGRSILLDKNNKIIAGNKTIENAGDIGIEDVEIVESDGTKIIAVKRTDIDLNTKKGREMALADNATAKANISWNFDEIVKWEMPAQEWGIEFESIEPETQDAEPQIDKAAELNKKWKVKTGDLWQIGEHQLLCGDSTKGGKVKADTVVTDVPYGISQDSNGLRALDYGEWDKETATDVTFAALSLCVDVPTITAFCSDLQLSFLLSGWNENRTIRSIAWVKPNPTVINGEHVFLPAIELAAHGRLAGAWFGGHCERNVWEGTAPQDRNHPNQKPVELFQWLIGNTCPPNGEVYEPFAGSGTTLVACQNLNRKCYAIEISPNYCAVILERMATAFPDIEIKRIEDAKSGTA